MNSEHELVKPEYKDKKLKNKGRTKNRPWKTKKKMNERVLIATKYLLATQVTIILQWHIFN